MRHSLRLLLYRPGFSLSAAIPLALAIASVTSIVTLVDSVLFRSLGMQDPGRLVTLYAFSKSKSQYLSDSFPEYRALSNMSAVVSSATAYVRIPAAVDFGGGLERLATEMATGDYFRTLGLRPAAGRPFGPGDDRPGAPPVALISESLWKTRFQRSPAVLGSVVHIGDVPVTIIGVMPPGYVGTLLDWGAAPSFWLPLSQIPTVVPAFAALDLRNRADMRWLMVTARLRPGATPATLKAALDVLAEPAAQPDLGYVVLPSSQARFFPSYRETAVRFLGLLTAVSAAVLLIACFNMVNLLLAGAAARERETSTRLALGATRLRILILFMMDGLLLSAAAALLSIPLSFWIARWLGGFRQVAGVSLNLDLQPDARVLLCGIGAGIAAGFFAGAIAAARAVRTDILSGLNRAGARPGAARMTLRDLFVAAQVACATVVLISSWALAGSLRDIRRTPPGYRTRGILLAALDATSKPEFYRSLLSELRARCSGAALAWQTLPSNLRWVRTLSAIGSSAAPEEVEGNVVSDGFFHLLDLRIEAGREFLPADDERSGPVILLNRTAAERFWPGQNPIGRSVRIASETVERRVIGIAADVQYHQLPGPAAPYFYLPLAQAPRPQTTVYLDAPVEFTPVLRSTAARLDRRAPLYDIRTMETQLEAGAEQIRLAATSISAAALIGTLLALAGVFAVTAWRVIQQKRDIAIRLALGAANQQILTTFLAGMLSIAAIGIGAGAIAAKWTSTLLQLSLRGTHSATPPEYLGSAALLFVLVTLAALIPARQILRITPAALLKVQ